MVNNYNNIYFLGIGGIGMSALAQYFKLSGHNVAGYDKIRSDNCIRLEKLGINIHYSDKSSNIPIDYKDVSTSLIVLTPAIPQDSEELFYFKSNEFKISKRSEILGLISNDKAGIAVAGTHGKTSVSTITAWIMSNSPQSCSAFLGGISKNFDSNILINTESDFTVVEADEFDRSFLQLKPSTAIITSIEPDHLDIYNNFETLQHAFCEFAAKIKKEGTLILHKSIDKKQFETIIPHVKIKTYGLNDSDCDYNLSNIIYKDGLCYFDINHPNGIIKDIKYSIGGNHNLENALAATSAALSNQINENIIKDSLESFKGVIRRFDIQISKPNFVFIDDYAHHPSEISAFLNAIRTMYPNKKITAVFQPHLYSRTKDFYKEFAKSLSVCENLILLPIYPAREKPVEGINSELILNLSLAPNKILSQKKNLINEIKKICPEILVTMGAGDIDQFIKPIREEFSK